MVGHHHLHTVRNFDFRHRKRRGGEYSDVDAEIKGIVDPGVIPKIRRPCADGNLYSTTWLAKYFRSTKVFILRNRDFTDEASEMSDKIAEFRPADI